jgi:hypothetical protein
MVVGIHTHFFQVVVLSAYPEAFLRIGNTGVWGRFGSQKIVFELIHTRVSKHQGRIILYHNGGAWYYLVAFRGKKIEKSLSNGCSGHHLLKKTRLGLLICFK